MKDTGTDVINSLTGDKLVTFSTTLKRRIAAGFTLPKNHDLLRGIRNAELIATRHVNDAYYTWLYTSPTKPDTEHLFYARVKEFLDDRLKIHTDDTIDFTSLTTERIDHVLDEMINAMAIEGATKAAQDSRETFENGFLAELEAKTKLKIPLGFRPFFTGENLPPGAPKNGGWYSMVALYVTEELKTKQRFESIFVATELVDIKQLIAAADKRIATLLAEGVPSIIAEIQQITARLTKIVDGIGTLQTGQDQILAMLTAMQAKTEIPLALLQNLATALDEAYDGLDIATLEQRLLAKAAEYQQLRDRLNRLTNEDPRVEMLRKQAAETLATGNFAEADQILETAEKIDMEHVEELEAITARRRLSAAATRAERAAAAKLRLAYRQAAAHYEAAAALIPPADTKTRWHYTMEQASMLDDQGREFGDNQASLAAIAAYNAALQYVPRAQSPLDGAGTQNDLGNALATLGDREPGNARLEEAAQAFRLALQERTQNRVPLAWARTQNNLGTALATLGTREPGTERLEEAVQAYRLALQEYTQNRVPLDWATTQNNLGAALQTLGDREPGTARLEEAIQAFRLALQTHTQDRVPLDWATTQNNLGNALATLGTRQPGTARLEEAVQAYRLALQERTQDRVPLDWASTQNNLGIALRNLGDREPGTARLEEALAAFNAALSLFPPLNAPYYEESWRENRETLLTLLNTRRTATPPPL
jgi:uncharacterized protein YqhQ